VAQSGHAWRVGSMSASLIGRLGSSAFRLSTNSSVDVAHGLSLLFGLGTKGPSIMGFEDEVNLDKWR
jgi:predicted metalloprotease